MSPSTSLRQASTCRRTIAACAIAIAVACSGEHRPERTAAVPPATRVSPVTETIHGVAQTDNYRWLEGAESAGNTAAPVSPDVAAWTEAQNRYARAVLDNVAGPASDRRAPAPDPRDRFSHRPRDPRQSVLPGQAGERAVAVGDLLAGGIARRRSGAGRSGDDRSRRADGGRVVLAVGGRTAPRLRHLHRARGRDDVAD